MASALACLLAGASARAVDIQGAQAIAFDQPQINALLQPLAGGTPFRDKTFGTGLFNISAFLDTGSSGIVVADLTAFFLEPPIQSGVTYSDVAIGGSTNFNVSQSINVRIAPSNATDTDNVSTYTTVYDQAFNGVRTQVGPVTSGEPLDVFGMPVMAGKVVVMDPKPLNTLLTSGFDGTTFGGLDGGPMNTFLYNPGTAPTGNSNNPGIPTTSHHVALSYGQFDRFTKTEGPPGAAPPTLVHNPFIGPNPVAKLDPNPPIDNTPPIGLDFGGHHAAGSFLLDTGAVTSFISFDMAARLHVRLRDVPADPNVPQLETFDPANPQLPGTLIPVQFTLPIEGLGGTQTLAGFYLDDLILHTIEGGLNDLNPNNFRYLHAPVYVNDVSVHDPLTGDDLTLDGVFGMNYLIASAALDADLNIGDAATGPFNWVTFDEPNGILGLDLIGATVPEPGSLALAGSGLVILAGYACRRRAARPLGANS